MSFLRFPLRPAVGRTILALAAACLAPPASATTYTVTVTADGVSANGNCTLREAIRAAATNTAVDLCPAGSAADTIVLAATQPYAFVLGEEVISGQEITIAGATAAAGAHVIELGGASRFLRAEAGSTLTLERLGVRNGDSLAASNPEGGCLRVTDTALTLRDVEIGGCLANRGGGLWFLSFGASQAVLERVSLLGNEARGTTANPNPDGGGAFFGTFGPSEITISDSRFDANLATSALSGSSTAGSGLKVFLQDSGAELTLRRSRVVDNGENAELGGQAALNLLISDAEEVVLEDLLIANNTVVGAQVNGPIGLSIFAAGTPNLWLSRLRITDNSVEAGSGAASQVSINGDESAFVELSSVLVAGQTARGLDVQISGDATLRAGHLTVYDHSERGARLANFSTGPVRLENSLLWGNGLAGSNDLETTGLVDADRITNHNWIGSLGDPDPQLVDPGDGDYDPQPGSPLIDAGDRTFVTVGPGDALNRPRVVGGETDIGALEEPGLLFADGFESGDTSAWSQVVP